MRWPALILYTERLPYGVGGIARGPLVLIRPQYRNDRGIHAHELEHVRQWWVTCGLHPLLYYFVRRYRLWSEVGAYRVQMQLPDGQGGRLSAESAARRLMKPRYRLELTDERALAYFR